MEVPLWAWGLFALGMFWLSVFLGTLAEWRRGGDIFDGDDPPPTRREVEAAWPGWLVGGLAIGLVVVMLPVSLVLMGPPYLTARGVIRLWGGADAEPGAAADGGKARRR